MRNRATTPLGKTRIRQSWSKYNLYNLSRARPLYIKTKTFFQQKWQAKAALRDYHGEQVREGQWSRMFRRTLRSVIPMSPAHLAENDGSTESAGRGSGLQNSGKARKKEQIPYMQMTFAPLERRLDTAVFRAMFASSARQARQFVVHGGVTVNGQKMRYPGYLLNPGDMFQVNPERVMFATGQPKTASAVKAEKAEEDAEEPAEKQAEPEPEENEIDIEREPREVLKDLLSQTKSTLASQKGQMGAKRKQDLRAFSSAVRRLLSRPGSSTTLTDSLEAQFQELQNQLRIAREKKKSKGDHLPTEQVKQTEQSEQQEKETTEVEKNEEDMIEITDEDYSRLYSALTQMQENPIDESKPYATPWSPRDYMSAFAHIPRYLEVNQNICAAIYLRHPEARPGTAEVPTPYGTDVSTSAFTWYLRRR